MIFGIWILLSTFGLLIALAISMVEVPPIRDRYCTYETWSKAKTVAVWSGVSLAFALFFGFITWGAHANTNINAQANIDEYCRNFETIDQRINEIAGVLGAELGNYQEFEVDVIDMVGQPEILFNYPQITSNEVLLSKVEELIDTRETLYNYEYDFSGYMAGLEKNNNGFWVPAFTLPSPPDDVACDTLTVDAIASTISGTDE